MKVDLELLTRLWDRRWPDCPPVAHQFRDHWPDRWVRFHSLPRSKRYAESPAEYQIILDRHNAVLAELGARNVYLFTVAYPPHDLASGKEPIHVGLHNRAVKWRPIDSSDVYVSRHRYVRGSLDALLRKVADDGANGVFVAGPHLEWLYHPYDGGADVILATTADRDALKARHRDWLSRHRHGL